MFGLFAPCPIRLTAVDSVHGWSSRQHARMCADVSASWRTLPLAVMTVQVNASSVQLIAYNGRNGSGTAHAPALTWTSSTRPCLAVWANSYENDFEEIVSWSIRHAISKVHWSGSQKDCALRQVPSATNSVDLIIEATPTTPYNITIVVYGNYGNDRQIGDYGGDTEKTDNESEAVEPYAAQWYRELHASRGSAYTTKPYGLVDVENIALSRIMSGIFSRTPEKYSANATPAHAAERLAYWVNVLGVPNNPDDPEYVLRQRCAAHFKSALGPSLANVNTAISELLGDAFVGIDVHKGTDLDNPPVPTFWPAGADDGGTYSIGGHTWFSRRAHIRINVIQPSGVGLTQFRQLMDVQLFQLLDRILPAWVTWNWSVGSDGFMIGVDQIGIDAI